jgi:hypothetical protein
MNTELIKTYVAKVDLSEKKGYAVIGTTDAKVNNTSVVTLGGANGKAVGIVVDGGFGAGTGASIQVGGYVKAMAGSAITAFANLKVNANGALIPVTTAGDLVVAVANEAIASGELGEVKVETPHVIAIV